MSNFDHTLKYLNRLIPGDVSRCSNNRCSLRTNCARYLQVEQDYKNRDFAHSYTRFGNEDRSYTRNCQHFIGAKI